MSFHNSRKFQDEAAAKRRRFNSSKVAATQARPIQVKTQQVIDLTTEDDEQEDRDQLKYAEADPMEIPAHLESDDYFKILSLLHSASESDVKRAYRKLAVQWHPDKNRLNPRAEEIFKRISEAYEVLSDLEKRKQYEKYDKAGSQREATQTTDSFKAYAGGYSAQHARDIFESFFGGENPFAAFFGGGQQRCGSKRFRDDPFESMSFGWMGMGMNMRGFGRMGGMSMMDQFFNDGSVGMDESSVGMFSTSTSSSSSMFTDRSGNVIQQKTTTRTGLYGRTETVTEEYRNGKLVNSLSSANSHLVHAERM